MGFFGLGRQRTCCLSTPKNRILCFSRVITMRHWFFQNTIYNQLECLQYTVNAEFYVRSCKGDGASEIWRCIPACSRENAHIVIRIDTKHLTHVDSHSSQARVIGVYRMIFEKLIIRIPRLSQKWELGFSALKVRHTNHSKLRVNSGRIHLMPSDILISCTQRALTCFSFSCYDLEVDHHRRPYYEMFTHQNTIVLLLLSSFLGGAESHGFLKSPRYETLLTITCLVMENGVFSLIVHPLLSSWKQVP